MENRILPIFKTHGSIGRGILSCEDEELIENGPISVISIAKKHKIDKLVVIDDSFLSFPKLYKNCNKNNIQLIFGVNFIICNDVNQKNEDSIFTESKISVLIKNSQGYQDLIKLHDAINANLESFYYIPRGDWKLVREYWTNNLELLIPPFDNFIHKNLLCNGKCIPEFGNVKPIITFAEMELPWNSILNKYMINYSKNNNLELIKVHPIYYYKNEDFKQYLIFRSIENRKNFDNPGIDYFCDSSFSFESFLNKTNNNLNG